MMHLGHGSSVAIVGTTSTGVIDRIRTTDGVTRYWVVDPWEKKRLGVFTADALAPDATDEDPDPYKVIRESMVRMMLAPQHRRTS